MLRFLLLAAFGVTLLVALTTMVARGSIESDLARIEALASDAIDRGVELAPRGTPTPVVTVEDDPKAEIVAGGAGVSLRVDCRDDARVEGGVPERAIVRVLEAGDGACAGWSAVSYEPPFSDPVSTWVRNEYLALISDEQAGVGSSD